MYLWWEKATLLFLFVSNRNVDGGFSYCPLPEPFFLRFSFSLYFLGSVCGGGGGGSGAGVRNYKEERGVCVWGRSVVVTQTMAPLCRLLCRQADDRFLYLCVSVPSHLLIRTWCVCADKNKKTKKKIVSYIIA